MKELTAAQGLLRCGECDTIFDAMKALSTTLPEERTFADSQSPDSEANSAGKPLDTRIRVLPANQSVSSQTRNRNTCLRQQENQTQTCITLTQIPVTQSGCFSHFATITVAVHIPGLVDGTALHSKAFTEFMHNGRMRG